MEHSETGLNASVHYHGAPIEVTYFKRDERSGPFYSARIGGLSLMVDADAWVSLLEALKAQAIEARNSPK